jgi:hypothetical protein
MYTVKVSDYVKVSFDGQSSLRNRVICSSQSHVRISDIADTHRHDVCFHQYDLDTSAAV